ncbi:MAG: ribonuclease HII [Nitrospirae bacterium]|nr:MAG: ribonuclease HII [Nitrospirota bacterium]
MLFEFDRSIRAQGYEKIAGVDEAGRGCIAGPVVAASVILPEDIVIEGVNDSKALTENQRERLFRLIRKAALSIGVGIVSPQEIDRINILNASVEAMTLSLRRLRVAPDLVIIDALELPGHWHQLSLIKADQKSASVAAASIVAKVIRDRIMRALHRRYPHYGFDKNKGYATRAHVKALKRIGPCPEHRRSFSPVIEVGLFE